MGQVIPKLTFPSRSPSRTTSQSVDTQKAGFGTATTGMWLPSTNQILPSFCHLLFYLKLNGWQLSIATGYPSNHIFYKPSNSSRLPQLIRSRNQKCRAKLAPHHVVLQFIVSITNALRHVSTTLCAATPVFGTPHYIWHGNRLRCSSQHRYITTKLLLHHSISASAYYPGMLVN